MQTYKITPEQKQKLLTDGFVLLPEAMPPELLEQWCDLAKRLDNDAINAYKNGENLYGAGVIEDPVGPRLMRYDDILAVDGDAVLDLLACPAMLAVAFEMCGSGVVPLQTDILYKQQHPHPVIKWHQGAPHARGFPYLNVGIYLDDADAGDGCVRYVPNTQHDLVDICDLSEKHGWDIPGVVEQPAKAGDILVQDMMILHSSPPKRSPGVRRTIYIEFRPAAGIKESGKQSDEWKKLRQRWMGLVLRRAQNSDFPNEWFDEMPTDLKSDEEEIAAIMNLHEPPIPSVYCHRSVKTEDYPVPSDLHAKN